MAALLESLRGACESVLVNDNAPDPSPHARILTDNAFAREGKLVVDRTPFSDFATARNVCVRLHRERNAGEWVLFIDADEVHGPQLQRLASNLHCVPADCDFLDGYALHFFQSFDWYRSIERAKIFIRFVPEMQWEGVVHEKLHGPAGKRIALPYLYGHYGWVLPIERQAQKEQLYAALGRPGDMLPAQELAAPDLERSFARIWPRVMRFRGAHPPAAAPAIARLRGDLAEQFAEVDRIVPRHQTARQRAANALMRLNYEQRWRLRALSARARLLLA